MEHQRTTKAAGFAWIWNGPVRSTGTARKGPRTPAGALHESAHTKPHP
jgi:hypothetical protein